MPSRPDAGERLESMRATGWVLPNALATGTTPTWTLVGTVDSAWSTAVDPRGLVTPFAPGSRWSLDWWIGADDRWHLPSADAGVRQHLIGSAPVVETLVRIPGGDAVERVYGVRGEAFEDGDEWIVVEVENRSPVPFALALAIRPATPEGVGGLRSIGMAPLDRALGRRSPCAVTIDGRVALVLPTRPAHVAGSSLAAGDVSSIVRAGRAAELPVADAWEGATCPEGLAQAAFVFPVAHTAAVRVVVPLGAAPGAAVGWPAVIPSADHVAAGWDAHVDRASRTVLPDPSLAETVAAARRSLLLAPWSDGLRRAGPREGRPSSMAAVEDTARIVAALDRAGHHEEASRTLRRWPALLAEADRPSPATDIAVIDAVATHRLLAGEPQLFDELLPDIVGAVHRIDRAATRSRLGRTSCVAAGRSLATMSAALDISGQVEGAADVLAVAARVRAQRPDAGGMADASSLRRARELLTAAEAAIAAGRVEGVDLLVSASAGASTTSALAGDGEPHDLVAAALLINAVRTLLVREVVGGLALLAVFPPRWYGGAIEVHDAPTAHGLLSYAVRWHGTRPALLWELDRRASDDSEARLTAPGLDPTWGTTTARGEALLAEVRPPADLDAARVVIEHPDPASLGRTTGGETVEDDADKADHPPLPTDGSFT